MRLLAAILALPIATALPAAAGDKDEPPLKITLTINGVPHEIKPGAELVVDGEFKDPKMVLTMAKERHFDKGGVSFLYPASYTFEAEVENPNIKTWTLSGNDVKFIIFRLKDKANPRVFAADIAENFGPQRNVSKHSRKLGKRVYKGSKIQITSGGYHLVQEVLDIPVKQGSILIILQRPDEREQYDEAEVNGAIKLMTESFVAKK